MDASELSTLAAVIFNEATQGMAGPFALLPDAEKSDWYHAAQAAVVYVSNGVGMRMSEQISAAHRAYRELVPDTWGKEPATPEDSNRADLDKLTTGQLNKVLARGGILRGDRPILIGEPGPEIHIHVSGDAAQDAQTLSEAVARGIREQSARANRSRGV